MTAPQRGLLLSLPNELLHEIAVNLNPRAVNAFMRANRRLYHFLVPLLDRLFSQHADEVLYWAARNKKESFFQLAIEKGANTEYFVLGCANPPLYIAVIEGWDSSVRLLVERGARSIGQSLNGFTALHAAVILNHLSTTRLLLDLGWSASVPANSVHGTQPLCAAIDASTEQVIELLIERGANVNARADESLLEDAVRRHGGGLAVIKMLLRNGFDTSTRNINGAPVLDNAFREAVKVGDEAVAEFLLKKGANIRCRSPVRYETALHTAIRLEHWSLIKMLLDSGVDINARNRDKETALFGAAIGRAVDDLFGKLFVCYSGDGELDSVRPVFLSGFKYKDRLLVIELLLKAGIDVNAWDQDNYTVLFRAVCRGSTSIIQLLLQHGADIHAQNSNDGRTALHAAAGCGDVSIVQLLLDNGSDINSQANNGNTALHVALQHRDIDTAKLLIEKGIDIAPRSKVLYHFDHNPYISEGANALYLAIRWGHENLARQLLAMGAHVDVQYNLKANKESKANKELRRKITAMFNENQLKPMILCEGRGGDAHTEGSVDIQEVAIPAPEEGADSSLYKCSW